MSIFTNFEAYSLTHFFLVVLCFLITALVVGLPKLLLNRKGIKRLTILLGVLFLSYELCIRIISGFGGAPFTELLPLHFCHVSAIMCGIMLITRNKTLFQVTYFWGLVGAAVSFMTPEPSIVHPSYAFGYFIHFVSHTAIVISVLMMIVHYEYRPQMRSLKQAVIAANVYMLFIAFVNGFLNTNFLFISEKPHTASLMDYLGPWPYYIIGLEILGIFLFFLVYLPYYIRDYLDTHVTSKNCMEKS